MLGAVLDITLALRRTPTTHFNADVSHLSLALFDLSEDGDVRAYHYHLYLDVTEADGLQEESLLLPPHAVNYL